MKIGCWEVPKPSYPPLLWLAEWKAPAPFSIFTHFLCFFLLKLLKLGEIDSVKFLAWKSGGVKFWTNSMSDDFVYYDFMRYKTTNKSEEPEIKITGFSSSCDTFFCSLFAIFTEERNLPTSKPFQNCLQKRGILAHSWGSEGSKKS